MAQTALGGTHRITGVTIQAWQTRHHGWTAHVRYTYEFAPASAPGGEAYTDLSRGELLDLLDAVKESLEAGTEY